MLTPHYQDENVTVYAGDCLEVLKQLPECSVDSVCTDPPYGLEFMGKDWDAPWKAEGAHWRAASRLPGSHSTNPTPRPQNFGTAGLPFQQWCEAWAWECLRILKPGGHLVAFGGTRTWHRLACAIEDAGFEIRDSIAWIYGSGFPKSMDVSKAIDKAVGAEREKVRTRITPKTTAGKGFSNEQDERPWMTAARRRGFHEHDSSTPASDSAKQWDGWGTALKPAHEPIVVARKPLAGTVAANVLKHGTGALNIDACRVPGRPWTFTHSGKTSRAGGIMGDTTGAQTGEARSHEGGRWPTNVVLDEAAAAEVDRQSGISTSRAGKRNAPKDAGIFGAYAGNDPDRMGHADSGGASRFFPVFRYEAKADSAERPSANGVAHPTVKPLDLMRWLVRLVTPPGGVVLEPFAGSGTTAEACIHEHKRCIAIEREADYLPLIVARLTKPMEIGFDFGENL